MKKKTVRYNVELGISVAGFKNVIISYVSIKPLGLKFIN